jgi:hypothetical protein
MSNHEFPTKQELHGVIYGTILFLGLYFIFFIQFQSYSKFYLYYYKYKKHQGDNNTKDKLNHSTTSFRNVKYYNTTDLIALNGDRTVGNFIEQSILFIPLIWIHAIFINRNESFIICCIYTFFRSFYPFVFYTKYMFASTIPCYIVLCYLFYQIIFKL